MIHTRTFLLLLQAWFINILFGAIVFNTIVFYPNIFHNIPNSLELTMQFLKVRGPHHFFPPFGASVILSNLIALFFWWKFRAVRNLLLISLILLIVFEFIFSVTFFWDKNIILFVEGKQVHSQTYLQDVADSFQLWHWVRVCTSGIASLCALAALQVKNSGIIRNTY